MALNLVVKIVKPEKNLPSRSQHLYKKSAVKIAKHIQKSPETQRSLQIAYLIKKFLIKSEINNTFCPFGAFVCSLFGELGDIYGEKM